MSEKQEDTPKTKVDKRNDDKSKTKDDDEPKTKVNKHDDDKSKTKDADKSKIKVDNDIPKPQSTSMTKKDEINDKNEKEDEHSLEDIEKELDELRPKPPSPETKRRIEEEQKIKDVELQERGEHKGSSVPINVKSNNDGESQHKDNELTPGEPDPTINDDFKIPVLNDRGEVELKPQLGSAINKNKNNNSSNNTQSTEEDKKTEE